jgi:hypothetical protein
MKQSFRPLQFGISPFNAKGQISGLTKGEVEQTKGSKLTILKVASMTNA